MLSTVSVRVHTTRPVLGNLAVRRSGRDSLGQHGTRSARAAVCARAAFPQASRARSSSRSISVWCHCGARWIGAKPCFAPPTASTLCSPSGLASSRPLSPRPRGCEQVTGHPDGRRADRPRRHRHGPSRAGSARAHGASLQKRFLRIMSHEIAFGYNVTLQLGSMYAEERVAAFALELTHRLQATARRPRCCCA
jgi:hypothetical protein